MEKKTHKQALRKQIYELKQRQTKEQLLNYSEQLIQRLENQTVARQAETVLLYYSLPDEVYTHDLVKRWSKQKEVILPVVVGDVLELRRYTGEQDLKKGSYGIWEPSGTRFTDYDKIDLVLVPGMAFDSKGNRLGRGKAYYDKLLPQLKAYKLGICFPFQFFGETLIPTEGTDIPMDQVLRLEEESI